MFTERKIQKIKATPTNQKHLNFVHALTSFCYRNIKSVGSNRQKLSVVSNAPDHKAVKLKLNSPNNKRGPGLWKFNNSLLDDESYATLIRENYSLISEKYSGLEDKRLKWELVKMELRGLTIP